MGEWLKPTVCKIVALTGYAGSNPAPGTTTKTSYHVRTRKDSFQTVIKEIALIAQLVEHTLGKGEVIGSSPIEGSSTVERPLTQQPGGIRKAYVLPEGAGKDKGGTAN